VDAYGNEYVASYGGGSGGRVDVFDDVGRFITELSGLKGPKSVAVDTKGNLYVFDFDPASVVGEVVRFAPTGPYDPEAGVISYGGAPTLVTSRLPGVLGSVAVDFSNNHLYVTFADDFIEEFDSAESLASPDEPNALLNTISNDQLNWSTEIAVDAQRKRLYATFCKREFFECGVLVLAAEPPYTVLGEIDGADTPAGEFLSEKGWIGIAVDEETGHLFVGDLDRTKNVYEFDQNYKYVGTTQFSAFEGGNAFQIAVSNAPLDLTAANRRYLFVPKPVAAGSVFAFHPPSEVAPAVEAVSVENISEREAELHGTVAPGGGLVSYAFQYVTAAEYEESGFANARTVGAGTIRGGSEETEVLATVDGLSPGIPYRFRLVATNAKGTAEREGAFETYWDAPFGGGCPNEALRTGFSSSLPDCRAYELVTPADTNGRPPKGVGALRGSGTFPAVQVSPSGGAASFLTEGGSLPGTNGTGGFSGDPYRASRGEAGWTTVPTGPSGAEASVLIPGSPSPDQGYSFWGGRGEGSALVDGGETRYVRYPDGRSELVGRGSLADTPTGEGLLITENGSHIVFATSNVSSAVVPRQLEENAPPDGTVAIYDRTPDEVTHVISLLPGEKTPAAGEDATYLDASPDGEGIAFSIEDALYLRVGNAVTYPIGEGVELVDVSAGGRKVFYLEDGDLYALDTAAQEVARFTETGDAKVVNVAPGGSRAYFVSTTAIAEAGENPLGATPRPGQQNLYLSTEGVIWFVGTVAELDVEGEVGNGLGLWTEVQAIEPAADPSRVSFDGSVLLFQSRADLDGRAPGGVPQIYRYDSAGNRLHCISCAPAGVAEVGGAKLQAFAFGEDTRIPLSALNFIPNLTPDGRRAFFESPEALVSRDSDEVTDVYEWEAEGVGSCARTGGCVYLISSGHSARENFLYGVSRSGDDVFFITEDILVDGDNDTSSIYDARVNGGFASQPGAGCSGEECRSPLASAPPFAQPATNRKLDGNRRRKAHRCPRGKRRAKRHGKKVCVRKHHRKHGKARGGKGGAK
jgi:hypothetical protein